MIPTTTRFSFWLFRLGLRPPRVAPLTVVRSAPDPLPSPEHQLTVASLNEAWHDGVPNTWSARRVAVVVLDAHGAAMSPAEVLAFVSARSQWTLLRAESAQYWRSGAAVRVRDDGRWELDREHSAVRSAREAVRERITVARRWAGMRPDPAAIEANRRRIEREREAHADQLARMRRVLIHAFPPARPEALVLIDVEGHEITTFMGDEKAQAIDRVAGYEIIGAVGVRALLRTLNIDPGAARGGCW